MREIKLPDSQFTHQQLFKLLSHSLEKSADEVFWMDSDSTILYVNNAACKKLGYSADELIGLHVWDWDPTVTKDAWQKYWYEIKHKQLLHIESQHRNKQGDIFPVEIKAHYVCCGDKELVFAFVSDISESKLRLDNLQTINSSISADVENKTIQLEKEKQNTAIYAEKLEQSNRRYELLIDGTNLGLWTWNIDTQEIYWSPKFCELLGFSTTETQPTVSKTRALVHPQEEKQLSLLIKKHIQNHQNFQAEVRLKCQDNQYKWFQLKGKADNDITKGEAYFVGSIEDINEKKLLELAFEFEQKKFEKFVNMAPVGIAINRLDTGAFDFVNKELSRITGYEITELNSMDYWELTPKKFEHKEEEQLKKLNEQGRYGPYEKEYITKSGDRCPVLLSGIKMTAINGIDYIWSVVQDITERKHSEDMIRQAKLEAEKANVAKSQFLASMSHEIRTPMNAILGALQLLQNDIDERHRVKVDNAVSSTFALLSIINDILDLSKIEAKMLSIEKIAFSLRKLVKAVASEMLVRARQKNLKLKIFIDKDCPDVWIGDPTRIRQILVNLVSNSIKFTEQGDVQIHVFSRPEKPAKPTLFLKVQDTGIGMDRDSINRLFEPFTQADNSTTRKYGGTGLGLSITKNLLDLMGAEIDVQSTLGKGSKFTVKLTIDSSDIQKIEQDQEESKIPNLLDKTILVVEDNDINQQIILAMLEPTQATLELAKDGLQAIKKEVECSPDLILMDIQMPELDGIEATKRLRKNGCTAPIIALTANVMVEHIEEYMTSGFNDHIGKPILLKEFYSTIGRFLTSH